MKRKIRVLVITYTQWRDDTNIGNSFSNIFKGMDDRFEFAHIYFKDSMPENRLCHKYFNISEQGLFRSILNRKPVGKAFYLENPMDTPKTQFSYAYNKARALRWECLLMIRDYGASLGKWKSKELDDFISDFNPDVIFGNLHYVPVVSKLMLYVKKKFNIPIILYPWDDYYSLKRKSISPFFWLRYLSERHLIKKCAENCDLMYTISKEMQDEYKEYFGKESKLLYKGYEFEEKSVDYTPHKLPLRLVYMGYIGAGRWKVLAKLAQTIKKLNKDSSKLMLNVYTMSPHTEEIEKALNIDGASKLMDPIPSSEIMGVLKNADVLIHVEPIDNADMYIYRLSFSTKLVDYFYNSKCLLAIGGNTSSMSYLKRNDAALVIDDLNKCEEILVKLIDNPNLIAEYAQKAWDCGVRNHKIQDIQDMLYKDFEKLVKQWEK